MCLMALAWQQHPRYPLVVAANRDEVMQRATAALDWWRPAPDAAPVLGGRDLQAGGTWMALSTQGRLAMVTNVRNPAQQGRTAPSRGAIVPAWLGTTQSAPPFWSEVLAAGHHLVNLLAIDWAGDACWYANAQTPSPRRLAAGLYGLSNAALDTPWPKVRRLKSALGQALTPPLTSPSSRLALETALFAALADRSPVADDELPDTGVGIERERRLAPAFIHAPEADYGTRCSTLLIVERGESGLSVHMTERQFDAQGQAHQQRRASLARWPLASPETGTIETTALA